MNKSTFGREVARARAMQRYAGSLEAAEFYAGYQLGLRRAFHGEAFDQEYHEVRMNLPTSTDIMKRWHGTGYRVAVHYGMIDSRLDNGVPVFIDADGNDLPPGEAVKLLRRSILGVTAAIFGELVGVGYRTVQTWEAPSGNAPQGPALHAIRRLLGP